MIRLGCREMGMDCSFIAAGKRPDAVKKMLFDHALRRHGSLLQAPHARMDILGGMDLLLRRTGN